MRIMHVQEFEEDFLRTIHIKGINTPENIKNETTRINFSNKAITYAKIINYIFVNFSS